MPELPEVETIRRGLERRIVGLQIADVVVFPGGEKCFPNDRATIERFVIGASIQQVKRQGKVILIELTNGYTLLVHLKMTGQLVFVSNHYSIINNPNSTFNDSHGRFAGGHPNDSLVGKLPDRSTRVCISFADGSQLFFNDQRKFGWVKVMPNAQIPGIPFFRTLGPEPLEPSFTPALLVERLAKRPQSTIKGALLDQSVVAGIGNIYSDESLWGARIHPATRVRALAADDIVTLHHEIVYVLQLAIEKGGSTDKNYVDADGKKGSYLAFARVFRREGMPCPRCGAILEKIRVVGRGTHICPVCQIQRET